MLGDQADYRFTPVVRLSQCFLPPHPRRDAGLRSRSRKSHRPSRARRCPARPSTPAWRLSLAGMAQEHPGHERIVVLRQTFLVSSRLLESAPVNADVPRRRRPLQRHPRMPYRLPWSPLVQWWRPRGQSAAAMRARAISRLRARATTSIEGAADGRPLGEFDFADCRERRRRRSRALRRSSQPDRRGHPSAGIGSPGQTSM